MYVITIYNNGKNQTPIIEMTKPDAWNRIAELVLYSAYDKGLLNRDQVETTLHNVKQAIRTSEKRNIIENAFFDKDGYPIIVILEDGYIIGEGRNKTAILVFDISFQI